MPPAFGVEPAGEFGVEIGRIEVGVFENGVEHGAELGRSADPGERQLDGPQVPTVVSPPPGSVDTRRRAVGPGGRDGGDRPRVDPWGQVLVAGDPEFVRLIPVAVQRRGDRGGRGRRGPGGGQQAAVGGPSPVVVDRAEVYGPGQFGRFGVVARDRQGGHHARHLVDPTATPRQQRGEAGHRLLVGLLRDGDVHLLAGSRGQHAPLVVPAEQDGVERTALAVVWWGPPHNDLVPRPGQGDVDQAQALTVLLVGGELLVGLCAGSVAGADVDQASGAVRRGDLVGRGHVFESHPQIRA